MDVQEAGDASGMDLLRRDRVHLGRRTSMGGSFPATRSACTRPGLQHDVPLITGMNADEGAGPALRANIEDPDSFESYVRTVYPGVADEMIAEYDVTSSEKAKSKIAHLIGDMLFAGPSTRASRGRLAGLAISLHPRATDSPGCRPRCLLPWCRSCLCVRHDDCRLRGVGTTPPDGDRR